MITDEQHPEMQKALQQLMFRLSHYPKRQLTGSVLNELNDLIERHRQQCRLKGIDFPRLVVLCVPRLGTLDYKRADLDIAAIKVAIVNFVRENPEATMQEVVAAFMMAYPGLHPDDVLGSHQKIVAGLEKKKEQLQ
jgi:hypothetical protein